MKLTSVAGAVCLQLLASASLNAQALRQDDPAPLKNWAAPLYWQPNQVEREASRQSAAQIQFSPNATSNTALVFVAVSPCRLVDTRGASVGFIGSTPFNGPYIPAGGTVTFPVQSSTETATTAPSPCGAIPSIAQAYSLNLTIVPHPFGNPVNYVTMWPTGVTIPLVSTLNDSQGAVAANAAIVPAGSPNGGINVFAYGATDVIIDMNGFYAAPTDLNGNTALGAGTLLSNTVGINNTATGVDALQSNMNGAHNTATGVAALQSNTSGLQNTAIGEDAIQNSATGSFNTAIGYQALQNVTTGDQNVAIGVTALQTDSTGYLNLAAGFQAMLNNTSGYEDTASGANAMAQNTTGFWNTAIGYTAMQGNTTGNYNTAVGYNAMGTNTTGSSNTVIGVDANATGNSSIAIGYQAGSNIANGNSGNITIGNLGAAGDSYTTRIGTQATASTTYIAGIYGASASGGAPVYVNVNGQLGTVLSSRRFKDQVADMGDTSSKLFQLRPVNFFYKPEYDDGSRLLQYGLIAEEVEKVYPEMVAYDADGKILTVKYQMLAPMLLNEVQKEKAEIQDQKEENRKLSEAIQLQREQNQRLEQGNRRLEQRLDALETLISARTSTVALPRNSQ